MKICIRSILYINSRHPELDSESILKDFHFFKEVVPDLYSQEVHPSLLVLR